MNSWCGGYCYPLHHQQFFHESCVTVSYNKITDYSPHRVYQQLLCERYTGHITISIIHNFSQKILCHSLLQRKTDYSRLISTISTFIQDGYSCSSAAQRSAAPGGPPPPTSDGGCGSSLCSGYMIIWLSLFNVYTNEMSISLDYPGQDRLPNWLSGAPQPLAIRGMNAFTPSYCWPRCWLCC